MKIRIVVPMAIDTFNAIALEEALGLKAPDTEIDVVNLDEGPTGEEYFTEESIAQTSPYIVDKVVEAEKDGCDGVYISCFGDPAVDASRGIVKIPVVGAFQPSAYTASLIADRWSIVTVSENVLPVLKKLARKGGVEANIASIRVDDLPLLELADEKIFEERLFTQIVKAVYEDHAEAIVLGCTGMGRIAKNLAQRMAAKGKPAPVINPTASAIGFLELLIRSGLSQSRLTYSGTPAQE